MLNACLTGVSGFGEVHYFDILRQAGRGELRLLAATVINQDQEREKCDRLHRLGCELFTDHSAMLDKYGSRLDLAFIPTGIPLHAPMALTALKAGANVFLEKPAAATIQDVRAMQSAEARSGRFVAVGYQTLYARETRWMKQKLLEGAIGRIRSLRCRCAWPRLDSYYGRNPWAGRLKDAAGHWVLDSPFNNAVSHQLNMLCFLAGEKLLEPARLKSIQAELYAAHRIESADTACLRATTLTGIPLCFFVTHCSEEEWDPEITVVGEEGSLKWTYDGMAEITRRDGGREFLPCETGEDLRDSMLARVRARVSDPDSFICGLEIASRQTLCVDGAHDSSAVHHLEEKWFKRAPEGGSIRTVIQGIEPVLWRAYEEGKLFSELGAPWAKAGKVVGLEGYEFFPGGSEHPKG
jgi:predicted dehydrogenase